MFKHKLDKIENSKQIKEILDKTNIDYHEESIIMDYIYDLERKLKNIKYIITDGKEYNLEDYTDFERQLLEEIDRKEEV